MIVLAIIYFCIVWLYVAISFFQNRPQKLLPPYQEYKTWFAFDELDFWINKLGKIERCEPNGTWDSGSLSFGILCFKEKTFIQYVKKFNLLPDAEDKEILNFIGDNFFQKRLARLMILDNFNNWKHWQTSILRECNQFGVCGIGFPPRPEIYKEQAKI